MKFKNLETGSIIEVNKNDVTRIEKLKGYPDKFEVVEFEEVKKSKNEDKETKIENKSNK